MTRYAFFEGEIRPIEEARISVRTHAFNYGTGWFGGLRGYWNEAQGQLYVFRIYDHYKRFPAERQPALRQPALQHRRSGRDHAGTAAPGRLARGLLHPPRGLQGR
jgi:hypothetical protein